MKQVITVVCGVFFCLLKGNAQVCPPASRPEVSTNENDPDPPSTEIVTPEIPYFDPNNLSLKDKKQRNALRLGYGMNFIAALNTSLSNSGERSDFSWFKDRPAHVFDLSGSLGATRKWALGGSFGFQKIGNFSSSRTYLPADYLANANQQEGLQPLDLTLKGKASSYSLLIYTEYEVLRFWKNFNMIARGEIGTTIYRAYMSVNYMDTCGCNKVPVSDWEVSSSFNAGVGLGLKWEYRFVGIKALAVYQSQTKVSFKSRDEYEGYTPQFDATNYNFKGSPGSALFAINKDDSGSARTNYSSFYVQFMLYFNLK